MPSAPSLCRKLWAAQNDDVIPLELLFVAVPGANDLDLHVGEQRRHRSPRSYHPGEQRYHTAHCHPRRKRHLEEHLVVLVTDYEAADVSLLDEFFGLIDELACGYFDLLGPGVLLFLLSADLVGLTVHQFSPSLVVLFSPAL